MPRATTLAPMRPSGRGRLVVVSALGASMLAGCAPGARVPWVIELGATAPAMAFVIVERRAGDCAGPPRERRVISRDAALAGEMDEVSARSEPGPQGFAAIVLDGTCQRIGSGCVDLTLGAGLSEIRVAVRPETPSACGSDCPCQTDAGTHDASGPDTRLDAVSPDASDPDAASGDLDAFLSPIECRARAADEVACSDCGGVWCDSICCSAEFVCCGTVCRRTDCSGMVFEP